MHKFFVDQNNCSEKFAVINGEDVKHIYKVLRLSNKDRIIINNGKNEEFIGEIEDVNKECVKVKIIEKLDVNNESPVKITLFQGLPKASKMDFVIQKGTEIGIDKFVPLITNRVIARDMNEFKRIDRLKKICFESAKQCKRSKIPDVLDMINFHELIDKLENYDLIVVPYENEESFGIKKLRDKIKYDIKNIAIIIGPEGGFEEEEIKSLKENGGNIITLGPRILRTETAGMVVATMLLYEFSDMGGIYESSF